MIALTLAEIAAAVGGELRVAGEDTTETVVDGIVDTDSRTMTPGSVFVAKPGAETDGHRFVGAAVAAGAAVAIVEHTVDVPVSQVVVSDAVVALGALAREVVARVRAEGRLRIVGITGSNGKTTTKNFLARILEDEGETVAPVKSFNNEVGAPVTMLRVTKSTRFLVSEFGAAAPGSIAHLAGLVEPDLAVVLMVGMAHAGGFGGIEATAKAKSELVSAARVPGTAVLNIDDPRVAAMKDLALSRGLDVIGFGQSDAADVRAVDIEVSASGTSCVIEVGGERLPLRLRVLGAHHITNALAAIASALVLGIAPADAVARLETVEIAERWRMQPLGSDRVRIINDAYNASPDSMAAALRTLAQITGPDERTVAVLGAMSELGESAGEEHDRIGLLAVRLNIQRIVVVGPEARRLYLAAVGEGSWDSEAVHLPDQDAAYEYLRTELRDGDRVLVKSSNSVGLRHLGDRLGELFS
ncbi:UDP-N-acetylmuramoyl-tripeptide--D-alanyl-D-alanine ligase [Microbacterium aurugineum]|uniref:UDP-N-acetylmuramoyl-tripeptide--D-alanyl-D- alanine ligase n=1 Tax=Microbacterium TaxID=33882 RepID=UPI000CB6461D|nr:MULTISPECIES: UDP-N-acetylmuramoyl-tripeptide--D-alanyl-D-alanine ligase [unclassified Microbacterium]MCE0507486.1 UDP-N-acetylmuramoyl-tripeptide--D-alanyl-D-alanine ligase [Microbacterium sp. KKR3/1]PKQ35180.1 MAG: UDP-N-acetylmuramoylalanyl-D-glutamate--2,6-diaminopimelate ligase [Actinobacteria bacterium HGW-Actinobacteria-11]UUE19265.1 UDP-N-acetylmuramoyl-tripeptide--D-alanyl-D-alanine ligase [Microbacterium sp. J1-1]